jgi:hypothetical protein
MPFPLGIVASALVPGGSPPGWRSTDAQASVAAATLTFTTTLPVGTVNGDYMLAFVQLTTGTDVPASPSGGGWSLLTNTARLYVYGKVASSEPATSAWTKTGSGGGWRVVVASYSGCSGNDGASSQGNTATATASYANLTTTADNTRIVHYVFSVNRNAPNPCPTGDTQRTVDITDATSQRFGLDDVLGPATAGSFTSTTGTLSASVTHHTATVAIKP